LSARDESSLIELARRYESRLAMPADAGDAGPSGIGDICFTANAGRSHFGCRLAITGATAGDLRRGLAAYRGGQAMPALAIGECDASRRPRIAFLFTGQGAQHAGMGRLLYETSPVYRRTLDYCAARLKTSMARGLLEVMFAPADDTPIDDTLYAQPLTFVHEYALAQLWRSWGIEPLAVLGHSLGEYVAACVAGVLSLDDALGLVAQRARLTAALPPGGAMAAVFAPEARILAEVAASGAALAVAAFNGPEHFVLSGPRDQLDAALGRLEAAGIRVRRLRVSYAAHSPLVEPVLPDFAVALKSVAFKAPTMTLVSNLTGDVADLDRLGRPQYWLDHLRMPVRFSRSMQTLRGLGITHCIEIGAHPVLLGMGADCVGANEMEWLPSLRRDRTDWLDLLESLQRLYVGGADVDWAAFDRPYARQRVALPTYPYRRRRHWMDQVGSAVAAPATASRRWARLSAALQRQSECGPLDLNAASYAAKWDCLARLTSAHAIRTLREAGLFRVAGERFSTDEVLARAGIAGTYRRLVQRWLDRLAADGVLALDSGSFVATAPLPEPDLPALWAEAQQRFVDNQPLLAYVRHCGDLVGQVLRGAESPLETLFPGGSFQLAEDLYERSTTMRYANGMAAAALQTLADTLGQGQRLRILEIGAGTGGTTAALLPVLSDEGCHYRFTDVSDVFLEQAERRFGMYYFVEYGRFDLDLDAAGQGYPARSFDVIVSANAVHASKDLRRALSRLHELLAPGGMLLLVESTTHMAWFDMTTGLIEGWQHFEDDLRADDPLLAPHAWIGALADAGFEVAQAWPAAGSSAEVLGQHVVVARVAGEPGMGSAVIETATAGIPKRAASGAEADKEQAAAFRRLLLETLAADRLEMLREFVRGRVMRVLRLDASEKPDRNHRLMDLGFDSLMAVQLRNLLSAGLGLEQPLAATLMFDHPTIDALAAYLLERLAPALADTGPRAGSHAVPDTVSDIAANAGAGKVSPGAESPQPAMLGADAVAAMSDQQIEALLLERLDSQ
jgi:malonyl CoA-acyl carrier protein transacylase/SAM-dependent methyltransferase/acyl carrier protein